MGFAHKMLTRPKSDQQFVGTDFPFCLSWNLLYNDCRLAQSVKILTYLFIPRDTLAGLFSAFDMDLPDNASPPISSRASHESKYCFTEEQRCMAKNAVIPTSLEDLDKKVRNDFSTSLVQVILIMS